MASDERELNPYAAPKEASKSGKRTKKKVRTEQDDQDDTIQEIVRSFQRTRSWISFFATLSYIGTALLIIGGIAVAALMGNSKAGSALGPGIFLVYLVLGIVYAVFGSRLFRYRDAINNVIRSEGRIEHIADAVEKQAQFWTLAGQVTIAIMVLYFIFLMFGVIAGVSAGLPR